MTEDELLKPTTFRDTVSTVNKDGVRKWIYALKPKGKLYNWRNVLAIVYLLFLFGMPFIKVNGKPFILINVIKGEFILFSKIFWPKDFFIFAIGMVAFIIFIVLFTIIFGRLFCGWACPQTIFMEFVFRKIEWWIEGSPSQQKKLNEGPWNGTKIFKKTLKHFLFIIISFLIAHTFLSYILGVDEIKKIISEPLEEHLGLFFGLIVFTFLFYAVFAFVRDIVCTTICPYGRLQGVMFDKNTMQISYDYNRGEPRGFMKKNTTNEIKGDCIDCKKCVQVCPTGIDIRNGVQLDCVGCTACIDACDEVMLKINKPTKLIRYASENEFEIGKKFSFTPRSKGYVAVLALLISIMVFLISSSKSVELVISRSSGQLFQQSNGYIINMYDAKIYNKTNENIPIELKIENANGLIEIIGHHQIVLKKEAINQVVFMVKIPENDVKKRSSEIKIGMYSKNKKIQSSKSKFLGPFNF